MRLVLIASLLLAANLALAADRTPAPLAPELAVKSMLVPQGFKVTLVAAEPDVVQPVSFCFDDRGRIVVAEALNYGEWQATGKDRIVILEDKDGDGRAETRKLFFEGFNYITGIEVGFGGVWVMSPPMLYFVPDRNGDDVPDSEPEVLFDGFGYRESRHNLANGFTWGPDGWLYAGHGRTSPSDVGRPGTPAEQRIHCDGGVVRIHPTRLVFENFADGTTNPWGVDFDDYGQCFVSNCVNPHLFHVIQGAHYEPWRNRPSSLYAYERIPTIADHLHYPSDQPKAMRGETQETLEMGGGHAHCGTLIYLGGAFPERYRNSVFMCNVHGRRINNDVLKRKGSGYVASHGPDFMVSGDPWFMGVTLKTGPDGSVYVSDWSDTGECHTYKPDRGSGRIFKISFGRDDAAQQLISPLAPVLRGEGSWREVRGNSRTSLTELPDAELVQLQRHPNDWFVRHSRRLLQERSAAANWDREPVHAALRKMLDDQTEVPRRLRALWALWVTRGLDAARLLTLLDDRHEHVRSWGVQLLCEGSAREGEAPAEPGAAPRNGSAGALPSRADPSSTSPSRALALAPEALAKFASLAQSDPSPVVRLHLAAALQRLPLDQRWAIAEPLARRAEDATDPNLPLMLWYGIEPLVNADSARFVKLVAGAAIPQVREFGARRFVDYAISQRGAVPLDPIVPLLATASDAASRDMLKGMQEALRGRKQVVGVSSWSLAYVKLKRSSDPEVRQLAAAIAVRFGDPEVIADLRKTVAARTAPSGERQAALESLIGLGQPDLATLLHGLLDDKDLRRAAVRGLATAQHANTPSLVLAQYAAFTLDEKQDAVATLTSRKEFALALLDAVEKKVVARGDISAFAARQLHALRDKKLTERLRVVWGEVRDSAPDKQQLIAKYKSQLTANSLKNADLTNGRLLFKKNCLQCHRMFGEGSLIGPDLTGSNRENIDYILSNILDPSAEISRDFRMSIVATKAGRILTGQVVESTPNRLTLQTATERVILARDDVEEVNESPLSMMPEGQLERLTKDEVRDLIGYLATPKQVPLPLGAVEVP